MMLVGRRGRRLLVCDPCAGMQLASGRLGSLVVYKSAKAMSFDVTGQEDNVRVEAAMLGLRLTPRYMDDFFFCFGSRRREDVRAAMDELFDSIASSYLSRIDVARNRENASNLLTLIFARTGGDGAILDFGCGVGIAKPVADDFGVDLVGYEPNGRMRLRAIESGLMCCGSVELLSEFRNSLRAVMASYVLHFPGAVTDLEAVWNTLLPRSGVVVANFHKSQGRVETVRALAACGARIESVELRRTRYHHGDYVVFHRT